MPTAELLWYKAPTDAAPGKASPFIAEVKNIGTDTWQPGAVSLAVRLSDTANEKVTSFPVQEALVPGQSAIVGGDVAYPDKVLYGWLYQVSLYQGSQRIQDFGGTLASTDPSRPGARKEDYPELYGYKNLWIPGDDMLPPSAVDTGDIYADFRKPVLMDFGSPDFGAPIGAAVHGVVEKIEGATPEQQSIFQTMIYGQSFEIPIGAYEGSVLLRFYFAEPYWWDAGQRVFDVYLDGRLLMKGFDVVKASGGTRRALIKEYHRILGPESRLKFVGRTDVPILNALEIVPE